MVSQVILELRVLWLPPHIIENASLRACVRVHMHPSESQRAWKCNKIAHCEVYSSDVY